MNPVAVARKQTAAPDGVLVQEAAAGGGGSYAALYDRYSAQIYNYCLRLTGSPEDAADATQDAFVNVLGRLQHDDSPVLDFASYLFAAARNESYALMRRRSRTHPSEDTPERPSAAPDVETDPERAVLLRDSQEAVRQANARLAPRHREVLALREVGERSYEEIGEIMGISENAAAQLIWRARAKMKGALTAGAVASIVATSDDCETARLLLNRLQDGELVTDDEHVWLDEHLDECGSCKAARGMLFEVAASYRLWAPVAVLATLRPEVLTRAGEAIGANWAGVHASSPPSATGAGGANGGAAHGAAAHGNGAHGGGALRKRPRGSQAAVAGGAVAAAVAAGLAISGLLHDDVTVTPDAAIAKKKDSAPAKPGSSPAAKASEESAPGATAFGVQGLTNEFSLPESAPVGAPREAGAPTPNGPPQGGPPRGGNPGTGPPTPAPQETPPANPPNGSPPGSPPGNPPGGQPGNPPANPPGGQPNPPPREPPVDPTKPPPPPPVEEPPVTPPIGAECTWPGHGGGPGGCPPGHGGVPPGLGGTPPGQARP